jgi:hypothetical protein
MTHTPFGCHFLPALGLLAATVCLLASPPVATALTTTDFSRYEVILQRRPFGEAPPDVSATALPTPPLVQAGPSFADRIQLCALTQRGDSYSVGIVDNAQKPSRTYFMRVGESEDGIEVLDVDYASERVLLRKSTEERWVDMNGVSSTGGIASPAPVTRSFSRPSGIAARRAMLKPRSKGLTREQYNAERAAGLRPAPRSPRSVLMGGAAPSSLSSEERMANLRKYNMDLIRAGGNAGPALPIPLSLEEDAQLVAEGHLAPPAP